MRHEHWHAHEGMYFDMRDPKHRRDLIADIREILKDRSPTINAVIRILHENDWHGTVTADHFMGMLEGLGFRLHRGYRGNGKKVTASRSFVVSP